MTHEHHDRDVVVERDGGTGVGTIVGIILAIVVVLAIVWFFAMGGFGDAPAQQQDIDIQPPAVEQPVEPAPGGEQPAP